MNASSWTPAIGAAGEIVVAAVRNPVENPGRVESPGPWFSSAGTAHGGGSWV
jgi:hypothetical protein